MEDAKRGKDDGFFVECRESRAEIDIFVVQEESFVKSVQLKKERSRKGERRAAYPRNNNRLRCFESVFFDGNKMIPNESGECYLSTETPRLRRFRFEEQVHTDTSERRIFSEVLDDHLEISGEKSRVRIENNQDFSASAFRRAIYGVAETAISGKMD